MVVQLLTAAKLGQVLGGLQHLHIATALIERQSACY